MVHTPPIRLSGGFRSGRFDRSGRRGSMSVAALPPVRARFMLQTLMLRPWFVPVGWFELIRLEETCDDNNSLFGGA